MILVTRGVINRDVNPPSQICYDVVHSLQFNGLTLTWIWLLISTIALVSFLLITWIPFFVPVWGEKFSFRYKWHHSSFRQYIDAMETQFRLFPLLDDMKEMATNRWLGRDASFATSFIHPLTLNSLELMPYSGSRRYHRWLGFPTINHRAKFPFYDCTAFSAVLKLAFFWLDALLWKIE